MSIVAHPQTVRVREVLFGCVREGDRGRVCVGEALRRQAEGRIVVENFDAMCVSRLVSALPRGCRVFCRAPTNGEGRVTLSRLEVYYPLETFVWRKRTHILLLAWIVVPFVSYLVHVVARDLLGATGSTIPTTFAGVAGVATGVANEGPTRR